MLNWHWQSFDELSKTDLYEILHLRETVFVLEQECAYQDLDNLDQFAWHVSGRTEHGQLAAYCRVVHPKKIYQEPAIGRVATAIQHRGHGLGRQLMEFAIENTNALYPKQGIRISAQQYLDKFYTELGFQTSSKPYLEDEIPHIEMLRETSIR